MNIKNLLAFIADHYHIGLLGTDGKIWILTTGTKLENGISREYAEWEVCEPKLSAVKNILGY